MLKDGEIKWYSFYILTTGHYVNKKWQKCNFYTAVVTSCTLKKITIAVFLLEMTPTSQ